MGGSGLIELVGVGASLVVGTVSADGEPRATRGWAVQVVDERTRRIRVVMGGDDQVSVENLKNGRVALTGADVRTLRSVQLKGRVVSTEPATPDDILVVADHSGAFFRAVHATDGMPIALLERLLPTTVLAVEFEVDGDVRPVTRAGCRLGDSKMSPMLWSSRSSTAASRARSRPCSPRPQPTAPRTSPTSPRRTEWTTSASPSPTSSCRRRRGTWRPTRGPASCSSSR